MTELNNETFDAAIAAGVTLVDFWAPWCGPCRRQIPIVEELAAQFEGKATIAKVNIDDAPETAAKFGIRSIPALLVFKDGALVRQFSGLTSGEALAEAINANL